MRRHCLPTWRSALTSLVVLLDPKSNHAVRYGFSYLKPVSILFMSNKSVLHLLFGTFLKVLYFFTRGNLVSSYSLTAGLSNSRYVLFRRKYVYYAEENAPNTDLEKNEMSEPCHDSKKKPRKQDSRKIEKVGKKYQDQMVRLAT